jgi:hypothetical protein
MMKKRRRRLLKEREEARKRMSMAMRTAAEMMADIKTEILVMEMMITGSVIRVLLTGALPAKNVNLDL